MPAEDQGRGSTTAEPAQDSIQNALMMGRILSSLTAIEEKHANLDGRLTAIHTSVQSIDKNMLSRAEAANMFVSKDSFGPVNEAQKTFVKKEELEPIKRIVYAEIFAVIGLIVQLVFEKV